MLSSAKVYKQKVGQIIAFNKRYKALRKHLDTMPVGYPPSLSGSGIRLLKSIFTPDEAQVALALGYKAEPVEAIARRAAEKGLPSADVEKHLASMEKKGAIFGKQINGAWHYRLVPFVIGFFEMQLKAMSSGMYLDARQYMAEGMVVEYLTTSPPQMRVVPVQKSITPEHRIATYDEIRQIIKNADGRIGVAECICRKGHDLLGDPCKRTEKREICLCFRDFHDTYVRNGWARTITAKQAMDIVVQAEKDGLVLEPSNEADPQFVCLCCPCCCGILEMFTAVPRPVDFVASNFYAMLDPSPCTGCGKCVKRCPMAAIKIENKKAILDVARCIGCGLCVTTCKPEALTLVKKTPELTPPKDNEALLDAIMANKKSLPGRLLMALKGLAGLKL